MSDKNKKGKNGNNWTFHSHLPSSGGLIQITKLHVSLLMWFNLFSSSQAQNGLENDWSFSKISRFLTFASSGVTVLLWYLMVIFMVPTEHLPSNWAIKFMESYDREYQQPATFYSGSRIAWLLVMSSHKKTSAFNLWPQLACAPGARVIFLKRLWPSSHSLKQDSENVDPDG